MNNYFESNNFVLFLIKVMVMFSNGKCKTLLFDAGT